MAAPGIEFGWATENGNHIFWQLKPKSGNVKVDVQHFIRSRSFISSIDQINQFSFRFVFWFLHMWTTGILHLFSFYLLWKLTQRLICPCVIFYCLDSIGGASQTVFLTFTPSKRWSLNSLCLDSWHLSAGSAQVLASSSSSKHGLLNFLYLSTGRFESVPWVKKLARRTTWRRNTMLALNAV